MMVEIGSVFAKDYLVLSQLAEGGMGAVYVVEQSSTGRKRALKVLRPVLSDQAEAVQRFLREAKLSAKIESEHVVEVIDAGFDEQTRSPFLVMELLDGADLSGYVAANGVPPMNATLEILRQLSHALIAAHRAGVIHRDLKPENVFVAKSKRADGIPTVKLLDFGIASMLEGSATSASTSHVVGSPPWMAPEQIDAARIRPATDVWAFGLLTFWLLTGVHYWKSANVLGATMQALLVEKLVEPLEPASQRARSYQRPWSLGADFDRWFACAIDRNPEQRTSSMAQAWASLEAILRQSNAVLSMVGSAQTMAIAPGSVPSMGPWAGPASQPTPSPAQVYSSSGVSPTVVAAPTQPMRTGGAVHTGSQGRGFSAAKWIGPGLALAVVLAIAGRVAMREDQQLQSDITAGDAGNGAIHSQTVSEFFVDAEVPSFQLQGGWDAPAPPTQPLTNVAITRAPPIVRHNDAQPRTTPTRLAHTLVRDSGVLIAQAQPPQGPLQGPPQGPRSRGPGPSPSRCAAYTDLENRANVATAEANQIMATNPRRAQGLLIQAATLRQALDDHLQSQRRMLTGPLRQDPDFVQMVHDLEQCRRQLRRNP